MSTGPLNEAPQVADGRPSLSAKEKLAEARMPERTVPICLRADLVDEFEALEAQLAEAQAKNVRDPRINASGEARGIAEAMEALRAQMLDSSIDVQLRALPRKEWDALVKRHPARQGNEEDTVAGLNVDTFYEAAIRACWVEPSDLEPADITELLDRRTTAAQYRELTNAVLALNIRKVAVPFSSRASRTLREAEAPATSPG